MVNIPTELLRTLVTVVDLRSFTKAAQALGVTQPAVSAQIKRLHHLLDADILDKSAPGVLLTPIGERVVDHARRLLSINDSILGLTMPGPPSQTIRVGVPGDFILPFLPWTLAQFRLRWPEVRFQVRSGHREMFLRELRQGELDLCVGMSVESVHDSQHEWREEAVWVHNPVYPYDPNAPVGLVSFGEHCAMHQLAVAALEEIGRAYEVVYVNSSTASLAAAVNAGLGVMILIRSRVDTAGLTAWDDAPYPKPADLFCGVSIREGDGRVALEQLADAVAAALNPRGVPGQRGRAVSPIAMTL